MKKKLALLLILSLILGILASCGNAPSAISDNASVESTAAAENSEASAVAEPESSETEGSTVEAEPVIPNRLPDTYPLISEEGMTMTAFQSSNPNLSDMIDTYGDLPWYEELARRTGISFEWQMSSLATVEEQFNLLIAANDLPNLICTANYYTDGTASAVENEIFTNLAPYLGEYAPDYKRLSQQDHVKPVFYDENGNIAAFYEIGREEFAPNNGVVIRGDLLEEQGLDVPITYDDYKQTLTAIKEAYGTPDPIFLYPDNTKWISAGKNVQMGFSLDENGETIYGPIEDNFREYLKIIHDWYESGLIYKDFYVIPEGQNINYLIQKMSSGKSVVTFGYCEFAGMIQLDEGQNLVAG